MNSEVHICPILLRTVIWKDGECTEDCKEEDCPISEVKSIATCEVGGVSYSTYFECKQQGPRRPVGVEIVRGLYGVMERDRIDKGVIVTTSRFTRDAIKEAEMLNGRIKLVDYQELQRLMRR